MKTIERQFYEMLPPEVQRAKRLSFYRAARIKRLRVQSAAHLENVTAGLREIGRAGLTAEQAASNLNANLAKFRKQNQGDTDVLDNKP